MRGDEDCAQWHLDKNLIDITKFLPRIRFLLLSILSDYITCRLTDSSYATQEARPLRTKYRKTPAIDFFLLLFFEDKILKTAFGK